MFFISDLHGHIYSHGFAYEIRCVPIQCFLIFVNTWEQVVFLPSTDGKIPPWLNTQFFEGTRKSEILAFLGTMVFSCPLLRSMYFVPECITFPISESVSTNTMLSQSIVMG